MFKILIVEDDAELNRQVCNYLRLNGYEATGCLSANDAFNAMYGSMFDMIISDIMMPGMDGFEFAKTVRDLNREIPILFMTAREDFGAKRQGYAAGGDDYMVKPSDPEVFYYLDAVEEALCFGWVDSVQKLIDGKSMQRFSPRSSNSPWTELNKARARRLENLGRMTDAGRAALPAMGPRSFRVDREIEAAMKAARVWSKFRSFPALYQRVRAYNVAFYKNRTPEIYQKALAHLIEETKRGRMFGEWNDYGRLPDD